MAPGRTAVEGVSAALRFLAIGLFGAPVAILAALGWVFWTAVGRMSMLGCRNAWLAGASTCEAARLERVILEEAAAGSRPSTLRPRRRLAFRQLECSLLHTTIVEVVSSGRPGGAGDEGSAAATAWQGQARPAVAGTRRRGGDGGSSLSPAALMARAAAAAAQAEAEEEAEGGEHAGADEVDVSGAAGRDSPAAAAQPHPPASAVVRRRRPPLVLLHGYGSGSALWLFNAPELASRYGGAVALVDWRGCASSPRAPPPAAPADDDDGCDHDENDGGGGGGGGGGAGGGAAALKPGMLLRRGAGVEEAESFFLSALEGWRAAMGVERMVLVGHSLGGYLSGAYASSFPSRVAGLILVSPAGISHGPHGPGHVARGQKEPPPPPMRGGMVRSSPGSPTPRAAVPRALWSIVRRGWDADCTPGRGLRWLGPCGRRVARAVFRGRASRWALERELAPEQLDALGDYMHAVTASHPASGEYALGALLAPGAWARKAVGPRILAAYERGAAHSARSSSRAARVARAAGVAEGGAGAVPSEPPPELPSAPDGLAPSVPLALMYGGTHDWMDAGAGGRLVDAVRAATGGGGAGGAGLAGPGGATLYLLPASGHHCYLESPTAFNEAVLKEAAKVLAVW